MKVFMKIVHINSINTIANYGIESAGVFQVSIGDIVKVANSVSAGILSVYATSCYFIPPKIVYLDE